ncbi:hypothetical protein [uncultured Parabacteroides sp.]|nr:hypothetical protein [uncultured Parabacteroides sp.]
MKTKLCHSDDITVSIGGYNSVISMVQEVTYDNKTLLLQKRIQ